MRFTELANEQRRQFIDVAGTFAAWRDAARKATRGSLRWVSRKGTDYLYRKTGKSERSLGRRSPETEAIVLRQGATSTALATARSGRRCGGKSRLH
jgi:hypothetical protein